MLAPGSLSLSEVRCNHEPEKNISYRDSPQDRLRGPDFVSPDFSINHADFVQIGSFSCASR